MTNALQSLVGRGQRYFHDISPSSLNSGIYFCLRTECHELALTRKSSLPVVVDLVLGTGTMSHGREGAHPETNSVLNPRRVNLGKGGVEVMDHYLVTSQ